SAACAGKASPQPRRKPPQRQGPLQGATATHEECPIVRELHVKSRGRRAGKQHLTVKRTAPSVDQTPKRCAARVLRNVPELPPSTRVRAACGPMPPPWRSQSTATAPQATARGS